MGISLWPPVWILSHRSAGVHHSHSPIACSSLLHMSPSNLTDQEASSNTILQTMQSSLWLQARPAVLAPPGKQRAQDLFASIRLDLLLGFGRVCNYFLVCFSNYCLISKNELHNIYGILSVNLFVFHVHHLLVVFQFVLNIC